MADLVLQYKDQPAIILFTTPLDMLRKVTLPVSRKGTMRLISNIGLIMLTLTCLIISFSGRLPIVWIGSIMAALLTKITWSASKWLTISGNKVLISVSARSISKWNRCA